MKQICVFCGSSPGNNSKYTKAARKLGETLTEGGITLVYGGSNIGLMGAIELAPRDGAPGVRGLEIHKKCFWDEHLVVRNGMDTIQCAPFLNSDPDELQAAFEAIRRVVDSVD